MLSPGEDSFSGLAYNSRAVEKGDIFFCVKGEKFDANRFIPDALAQGAAYIVSESPRPDDFPAQGAGYVQVDDIRQAMADAADYFYERPSTRLRILGVTGTNGKTSTTHIIEHILTAAGERAGVVGTMGARWPKERAQSSYTDVHHTTPQSLDLHRVLKEMADERVSHVAMEISSHALALKRVAGCQFAAACLTNITQDHLDFHKTMENYWKAKRILFEMLSNSEMADRHAIVNIDEELAPRFLEASAGGVTRLTYGFSPRADYRVLGCTSSDRGTFLTVKTPSGSVELELKLLGAFNIYNALAALTVCHAEGVSLENCRKALSTFTGVSGRFEVVGAGESNPDEKPVHPLCIVDYAHSPDGLENVLKTARELVEGSGKLVVVFGCGGDRDTSKRPQMGEIAERLGDRVVVTSDNPRSEDPQQIIADILAGIKRIQGVTVEPDRATAINMAIREAAAEDVVVVAGKGHETYQILADRTLDFDDRIEVRKALAERLGLDSVKA